MKKKLIKTENYLLVVDDSEIKVDDWVYNQVSKEMYRFNENLVNYEKKVIAHLPINDSADLKGVPLLPPFSRHQEDGLEELVKEHFELNKELNNPSSFKAGYNKAKEKYIKEIDKQISDFKHDLKESTSTFVKQNCEGAIFGLMRLKESLSQPKTPTHFEFETKITHEGNGTYSTDLMDIGLSNLTPIKVIKTTTNSQGQVVACGKYIY